MKFLSKVGTFAVGALFAASAAVASSVSSPAVSSVDIVAMDTGGDGVMFTVTYNPFTGGKGIQCASGGDCIESILFDLTATEGETNALFGGGNNPVRDLTDAGLNLGSVSYDLLDTADANGETDRSTRNALQFTFAAQDFDPGNQLGFQTWVQRLSSSGGGIDESAEELFASVTLENGQSASGFFASAGTGKAVLSLSFDSVSEVPLPASALLLLGGIAGLGAMRRRKTA